MTAADFRRMREVTEKLHSMRLEQEAAYGKRECYPASYKNILKHNQTFFLLYAQQLIDFAMRNDTILFEAEHDRFH